MQITPANIKLQTSVEARRGSGRSMATLLAAQLWAAKHEVALFVPYDSKGDQITQWLCTIDAPISRRISVFGARNLAQVHERLRGHRFEKVLVDHAIVEASERDLAEAIKKLEQLHANELRNLEVIR